MKRRLTNPDEWIVVENTHEPLISLDVCEAANLDGLEIEPLTAAM